MEIQKKFEQEGVTPSCIFPVMGRKKAYPYLQVRSGQEGPFRAAARFGPSCPPLVLSQSKDQAVRR